jgi:hypothetical protein
LLVIGSTQGEARTGDQKSCGEQAPAQSHLQLAGGKDTEQAGKDRKSAKESAVQVCSLDPSIYTALAALLLEHQEGESALKWAACCGLEIAPEDPNSTVEDGEGFPKSLSGIPKTHD